MQKASLCCQIDKHLSDLLYEQGKEGKRGNEKLLIARVGSRAREMRQIGKRGLGRMQYVFTHLD